ncbi:MAG: hypothetical protein SFY69_09735 [Planctomycetota bacterium]|nr:hypothetical protein [Planctomycetota bacterium]
MTAPLSIPGFPLYALILAGGVVAGLLLLIRGGALLRPALGVAGVAGGVALGLAAAPGWNDAHLGGLPVSALLPLVGGLIGGAIALAVFRLAIACGGAVVFGALGALGAVIYLAASNGTIVRPPAPESLVIDGSIPPALDSAGALLTGETGRFALLAARDGAASWWADLASPTRETLALGAAFGALVGLLGGSLAPQRMGGVVTGLLGAGIVLASAVTLMSELGAPLPTGLSPAAWLGAWGALGLLGVSLQWSTGRVRPSPSV